jgi:hypothetical protein
LEAVLDSVSSSQGTPWNETLQGWKDRQMDYSVLDRDYRIQIQQAADTARAELIARYAAFRNEHAEGQFLFVQANLDNPVGRFVYGQVQSSFSAEQKQLLNKQP